MRNILIFGALALILVLIVANGPTLPHSRYAARTGQAALAVLMYDEHGNPEIYDEVYPDTASNGGYTFTVSGYEPDVLYYDYYDEPYTPNRSGAPFGYDYWDGYYYEYTPPPPPSPWYVQALPGFAPVVQPIVQGIAPSTKPAARPACSISANPSVVSFNGSVMLRWVSSGAEWADLTDLGAVDLSGSWPIDGLTRSRTFTLNLSGAGGAGSCSTVVTVR